MIELKLIFDYENTGFSRTHYIAEYKGNKKNIVVIHGKYEEIATATRTGEPESPIKENITIYLNNKKYITKKLNTYTTILKEIKKI